MEQATTPTPRTPEVQQPRANSTEQVDKPATNIMERLGAKSQQNPVEIQVPYRNPVEIQVPYQKSCSDTGPIQQNSCSDTGATIQNSRMEDTTQHSCSNTDITLKPCSNTAGHLVPYQNPVVIQVPHQKNPVVIQVQ